MGRTTTAAAMTLEMEEELPVHHEGVVPPEYLVRILKVHRDGDIVHIWGYNTHTDPMGGPPQVIPAVIMSMPVKVFDAFMAAGLLRVAEKIQNGHASAAPS